MSKRVYEFAKEHDLASREVVEKAQSLGMDIKSHMASIDPSQQEVLTKVFQGKSEPDKKAAPKAREDAPKAQKSRRPQGQEKPRKEAEAKTEKSDAKPRQQQKRGQQQAQRNQGSNQGQGGRRNNRRNRRRNQRNNRRNAPAANPTPRKFRELPEILEYEEGMNILDISKLIYRDATEIITKLMPLGVMATINQALSKDVIEMIALEYGIEPVEKEVIDEADLARHFEADQVDQDKLVERPPVVTIMGHVDHGKTTLLDTLRSAEVAEGEAGGITQHIGAYQVHANGKLITFLDTPGHEAFTTMRSRGADITDIAIIVVAADDGVMPQTVEAINHAKHAEVPLIVAINKMDLPTANPDRVKQELTEYEVIPEEWGGDNIFVEISAKQGDNIEELLEMILLVAELEDLKADPTRRAIGTVIEARLDRNTGATATLLVQQGTLHVGDPIVVGDTYGRVRTLVNDHGRRIREAAPSTPVEITGLNDAPQAGDLFAVFEDERAARAAGEERAQRAQVQQRQAKNVVTLDNLFESLQEGELRAVNVIIKGDVQGSVEALSASLQGIEVEGVKINIVHQAVGGINESDISLAEASGAIIIGFNVRPTPQARRQAQEEGVDIRLHNVIYSAIDEIETAMKGMLDPEYEEEITGHAVVRETFTVSKVGTIAGSYMTEGFIQRSSQVRVIRNNIVVYDGKLSSLKRFQDDVREVKIGYEFGLMIENYNDLKVDDVIEAYRMVEIERK